MNPGYIEKPKDVDFLVSTKICKIYNLLLIETNANG